MDLGGGVFDLDAETGSWTLGTEGDHADAVLSNGAFRLRDGSRLVPYGGRLTLRDVRFEGDIDMAGERFDVETSGAVRVEGSIGPSSGVLRLHPGSDVESGGFDFGAGYASGDIRLGADAAVTMRGPILRFGPDPTLVNEGVLSAAMATSGRRDFEFDSLTNSGLLELLEHSHVSFTGDVLSSGAIRIGAETRLESDLLFLEDSSLLEFVLGTPGGAKSNGVLASRGDAAFAGDLLVSLEVGYTPALDDEFDLIANMVAPGSFASVTLPDLPSFLEWDTTDLYPSGIIRVTPAPASLLVATGGLLLAMAHRRRRSPA
jgi:hypothetical protein